jgi:hypothetical protein
MVELVLYESFKKGVCQQKMGLHLRWEGTLDIAGRGVRLPESVKENRFCY